MKTRQVLVVVIVLVVGFGLGWGASVLFDGDPATTSDVPKSKAPTTWICPMHPEVRQQSSGKCWKCQMDLVPLDPGAKGLGPRQLAMTPAAVALAQIRTERVQRRFVSMPVRMIGKIGFDETRVRTIAARVAGRLDRLYVDYTGISVKKGDHLVWLYSPQLLQAQQELLEAKKRMRAADADVSKFLQESNRKAYAGARDKLLLWGLSEDQVDEIEKNESASDHMMIRSPSTGVVIHKALDQGGYVKEGTPIYRIADLTHLWVRLDAYEQDLPWLRYGQLVSVQTEAYPGEVFQGRVSFLDPILDDRTRTVKVRVNLENVKGRLKPGMFVHAVAHARIGAAGNVLEPGLAGKWISPMHPEIIKDGPGKCDVCGMDLVPAEKLGYVLAKKTQKPLVVPSTAVLITGTRAVVYVEVEDKEKPTFEGREVVLGPRAGNFYIVRSGLAENERIVTNGTFRIDSSMQILAKPSMMSMAGEKDTFLGSETTLLRKSLRPLFDAYFLTGAALAADDPKRAHAGFEQLRAAWALLVGDGLAGRAKQRFDEEHAALKQALGDASEAQEIEAQRTRFEAVTAAVLGFEKAFRHVGADHFQVFCPMAFDDKGAFWIQREPKQIRNPYFGKSMLVCGEVEKRLPGVPVETTSRPKKAIPKKDGR